MPRVNWCTYGCTLVNQGSWYYQLRTANLVNQSIRNKHIWICWISSFPSLHPYPHLPMQGNQEAPAHPEAMAQPFPPAQYPTPPQNGIPAEYATAHTHQPADYTGPSTVTEHALTLYTPTHSHSEQPGNDSNTTALPANTVTVSLQFKSTLNYHVIGFPCKFQHKLIQTLMNHAGCTVFCCILMKWTLASVKVRAIRGAWLMATLSSFKSFLFFFFLHNKGNKPSVQTCKHIHL